MLRGEKIGLRARRDSDVPILLAELYNDVPNQARADSRPWRPVSPGLPGGRYAVTEPVPGVDCFSVVRLDSDELAGEALLWGIDDHNRLAHLGISLRPAARGQGLGTDVVRVLCHYGFTVRGLHRLQIDTLADNGPMIRAGTANGFMIEGTTRRSAWVMGSFVDEVVLGLLASEWHADEKPAIGTFSGFSRALPVAGSPAEH